MQLESLRVRDCRNLVDVDLELSASLNAFEGHNGAGKTSILESVDVLVRGRSFRTSSAASLINADKHQLAIESTVIDETGCKRRVTIHKGKNNTQRWLDGEKVLRQSELSQYLPVVLIHPNVGHLVSGSPSERRIYLDWGLFHVEPGFSGCYKRFNRLLAQRNAALKQRARGLVRATNESMLESGLEYDCLRRKYLEQIEPVCKQMFNHFGFSDSVQLFYLNGWNETNSYRDCLISEVEAEYLPKYSGFGPHRADLEIRIGSNLTANECSRGQQKIIALCMKLAQATLLQSRYDKDPVLLIDELPAELDGIHLEKVLELVSGLNCQVLITCVSREQIVEYWKSRVRWFHVEHGTVTQTV